MASVDNRIVRMEFDNKEFERRIKVTMQSLKDLDKALKMDGASKGLSDISKSASLLDRALRFDGGRRGLRDTSLAAQDLDRAMALNGAKRGIKDTTKAAQDLDKSFKLDGAKKGLADVDAAAKRVDLSAISDSAQRVGLGFITLSTIAITALATITQHAIMAGAQITKALSFDLVMEGFREFELNMGSIQTILANTRKDGTNLEQVNEALDTLNRYSDQTIYNFGQMARNIGTFTAAGVDLQTSVDSIKGISNLAAISGSSSEQASTAMYQLSQAISTGTLRLMDWNSVVNAGMGGEVFQEALFESGKALKTIEGVGIDTTFQEWTDAGNSFRDSLETGWLTAEVLTTTLQGFTGEMSKAELLSKGFTEEQAQNIIEMGEAGVEAATKVRTLTQLINTIKESIASGWSQSFRTVIGDFEQSSILFTKINDRVSEFVGGQADARNELLQGWADLGGRLVVIKGFQDGFEALGDVLGTVRDAFRDVFPPLTSERLFELSDAFREFMENLKPSEATLENISDIFHGLFSALDLGWETIKAGVGFLKELFVEITGFGEGNLLDSLAGVGQFFTVLREGVDKGQVIKDFFDDLLEKLQPALDKFAEFRENIADFFSVFTDNADEIAAGTVSFGDTFLEFLESIVDKLAEAGEAIAGFFRDLFGEIAKAIDPRDADLVLDALNVSLLGGIALLLRKFLTEGLDLDFSGGIFENISGVLEELTSTLEAMQTNLRADALMKIAIAIGILTASLAVMSLIDADALARALGAMAVGFGQLMGAFFLLNGLSAGFVDGAVFVTLSTGMILMATAVLILSAAVAALAQLSWEELAKGLGAVMIILGSLTLTAVAMSKFVSHIFVASAAMSAMAIALTIMAGAVALFGNMDFGTMAKGLLGVTLALGAMVLAMRLLPGPSAAVAAAGLVLVGGALVLVAKAVQMMGGLSVTELAKGLVGMAVALGLIAAAVHLIPASIVLVGPGMIAIGIALGFIADALAQMGGMSAGELAKGLIAMALALGILAVATHAIQSAIAGAASIGILAGAMLLLAQALKVIGDLSVGQIAAGLVTLALALGIFLIAGFLATKVSVGLLALGAAMFLVGASFALFGIGVEKIVNAMIKFGESSETALDGARALGKAIPLILVGLAEGLIEFGTTLLSHTPEIVEIFAGLLGALIDAITEVIPKIGELIMTLIETILEIIQEAYPMLVETGIGMILALLGGIADSIDDIVEVVVDIIAAFINAIADNLSKIIDAGVNLLTSFLLGLASAYEQIFGAVGVLVSTFLLALANLATDIADAGTQALVTFLSGITNNLVFVINSVTLMITTLIDAVGNMATDIATAGTDALVDFLEGITNNLNKVVVAITTVITTIINTVSNAAQRIITAGANAIVNFINGLGHHANRIVSAGVNVVVTFLKGVASNAIRLATAAADILIDFLNALAAVIREKGPELRAAGANIASAVADGITGGLASKAKGIADSFVSTVKDAYNGVTDFLGMNSPSKLFIDVGKNIGEGLAIGLSDTSSVINSSKELADVTVAQFRGILEQIMTEVDSIGDMNPVITPIMDLTDVEAAAGRIHNFMPSHWFVPSLGIAQGQAIAKTSMPRGGTPTETAQGAGGVLFEQNIYAPTQLSTADIYKQTRNQITLAKDELEVP